MAKGKKFIDKKKAVTYRLVRAETNADENAPKYTFVPVSKGKNKLPSFLPPSLFPTETHDEIENATASPPPPEEPGLDPDVARALEDDFDFDKDENILEDDFVAKANAGAVGSKKRERYNSCSGGSDDDEDDESIDLSDDLSDDDSAGEHCQVKSKGYQYSMTSAVPDCSESLKAFNEKFEKFLDLYDDDEIGALDFEEIDGHHSPEDCQIREIKNSSTKDDETLILGNYDDMMKSKILYLAEQPETYVNIVIKQQPKYDCESIQSTYSNIYNHPTVIMSEPKVSSKTLKKKLTKSNLKKLENEEEKEDNSDDDVSSDGRSIATTCNIRPKNETPEERKLRKRIVKEARKENRASKKENKKAFKLEKKRQGMQQINALRNAGIKIT